MRVKTPPRQRGYEGQVIAGESGYLWYYSEEQWLYAGDLVSREFEEILGEGRIRVFNLQNETIGYLRLRFVSDSLVVVQS